MAHVGSLFHSAPNLNISPHMTCERTRYVVLYCSLIAFKKFMVTPTFNTAIFGFDTDYICKFTPV